MKSAIVPSTIQLQSYNGTYIQVYGCLAASIGDAPMKYRRQLERLIAQYTDVFAIEDEKLGTTDAMAYKIDTGNAAPVASQRNKTPYYVRKKLKRIIDANLESELLEPCSSPWAAPVLLVKKANG